MEIVAERKPIRTQFLVFTLFGEYVRPRNGTIWTSDLLYLLEMLGVTERAARSALSRMTHRGWLKGKKRGRRSQYSLTERCWALLRQGEQRIFESPFLDWDEQWHLVVYSLPEEKNRLRRTLRRSLTWLGYASLAPGTWICPHSRKFEVESVCEELGIQEYVEIFSGTHLGHTSDQDLMSRCWELSALETQYQNFVSRYQPDYFQCLSDENPKKALIPEECFVRRFWLTHEFQSFPLKDPNLPITLLPTDWAGTAARELFHNYRQLLATPADDFVDSVFDHHNTS